MKNTLLTVIAIATLGQVAAVADASPLVDATADQNKTTMHRRAPESLCRAPARGCSIAPVMAKAAASAKAPATTVDGYLATLPEDRRSALEHVRRAILDNLGDGFEEGMQYGMIGFYVPHRVYPPGYHCDPTQPLPFVGLGSQKNHMAMYLMCVYGDATLAAWFEKAWKATGKKLDMGKACVRFKRIEDVPLDVVGAVIAKVSVATYIKRYEATLAKTAAGRKKAVKKKVPAKKTPATKMKKKTAKKSTKKTSKKKAAKKKTAK